MKKLTIISMGKITGNRIREQIEKLIGSYINIEVLQTRYVRHMELDTDLILFTSDVVASIVLREMKGQIDYVIAKRVINHKNIQSIISLPPSTEVLLVNDSEDSALEAIEQLREIGFEDLIYHPVYPGVEEFPKLHIAITPGEEQLVPSYVTHVMNIGTRIVDINTIHEILSYLKIEKNINMNLTTQYVKDIVKISKSIEINRRIARESEKLLEGIFNNVESGIGYVDNLGRIIRTNYKLDSMLGKKKKDLYMKRIQEYILELDFSKKTSESIITEIEGRQILVNIDEIVFEHHIGYIVYMEYTDRISKLNQKIKKNYEKQFVNKLYTLKDYMTSNEDVKKIIKLAEKFSKTDGTILIQGENGTGKEIIAQGIHVNSYRRNKPFVPVNIAAITPNLLESELFGYEEGAFTGAQKGGKAGLFEMANGGTIFIDEIGDAPLDFQVKLLRVLQEKRIRRVGGAEEILVDVRIIGATNKNLIKLIDKEKFREDLFFRLNILPLKTVPLRRRKEDINYLLNHFTMIYFNDRNISCINQVIEKDAIEFLQNYKWRGNVRELINVVEYISLLYEGKKLSVNELPHYMIDESEKDEKIFLDKNELWVLEKINDNRGIGRNKLKSMAEKEEFPIGEGKIRGIIGKLKKKQLIKNEDGKGGCMITKRGMGILESYNL
ncbi:sigma-54 interaction domain-containing protein [Anaeromicrobium sediminis]|nr:sigma 54-interacting transcriptional regulator [Anaeromicrobium sediminis]